MTLFEMACFLSAANHLNFSLAAKEVYISQPAMSAKISSVEKEFGVKLFYRDSHKVELTPAGKMVYAEFTEILDQYNRLLDNIKNNRISGGNHLSVCYNGPSEWAGVHELIQQFHVKHPEIEIDICIGCWGEYVTELLQGHLDIIFTEMAEIENINEINSVFMFRDYAAFAVPKTSALARFDSIKLASLSDQANGKPYSIVIENDKRSAKTMRQIYRRLGEAGLNMENPKYVDNFEVAIAMVSSNLAIAPIPRSFKVKENKAIRYVDIDSDKIYLDFCLAWMKSNQKPAIRLFSEFCRQHSW